MMIQPTLTAIVGLLALRGCWRAVIDIMRTCR